MRRLVPRQQGAKCGSAPRLKGVSSGAPAAQGRLAGCLLAAAMVVASCSPVTEPPPGGTSAAAGSSSRPIVSPSVAESQVPADSASRLPTMRATALPAAAVTAETTVGPTPTNVPPPVVCLLPAFAQDVEDCGRISHYRIDIVAEPAAARVTGSQEISYTNLESEPLTEVYLRLLPNAPGYGGDMAVERVARSGRSAPVVDGPDKSTVLIPMVPPLAVGQSITLAMDFVTEVPTTNLIGHGLFSYYRGIMALPTAYPLIPVHDEAGWRYEVAPAHGDDVYADVAAYYVRITAPSAMSLIASGACSVEARRTDTTTWACEGAPMREFVFILSDSLVVANRDVEGVVVNSYFRPEHSAGGSLALDTAVDALAAFNELFGPYPYTELDVVATPNLLGGMEYPGLIVIEEGLYTRMAGVEWLAAHEVAHQWWFAVVGNDQIDDPWLDEALTQYSTMLYYEFVHGPDRGAAIVGSVFEDAYERLVESGRDLPAGLPASAYSPGQYFEVVYDKGALYFHELRGAVGDESFFGILQTYYRQYRYRIASPDSFLDVVESVTGDRHLDIYQKWIGQDGE